MTACGRTAGRTSLSLSFLCRRALRSLSSSFFMTSPMWHWEVQRLRRRMASRARADALPRAGPSEIRNVGSIACATTTTSALPARERVALLSDGGNERGHTLP